MDMEYNNNTSLLFHIPTTDFTFIIINVILQPIRPPPPLHVGLALIPPAIDSFVNFVFESGPETLHLQTDNSNYYNSQYPHNTESFSYPTRYPQSDQR